MQTTVSKMLGMTLMSLFVITLFSVIETSDTCDIRAVEIIRDSWSIPHIFAETSEGVFFGLGYATAEDRMFQMEFSRRVVQGRLSEIIGESGVESDKYWRILGWYRTAKEVEENLDSKTKKLLQAYAAGVNAYLEDHKDSLLYLFDSYGIQPEPWRVADSIACWYRVSGRFSGIDKNEVTNLHEFERLVQEVGWEQAITQMSQSPIIDESGAIVRQEDMDPLLIAEIEQYSRDHGYVLNETGVYVSYDTVPKASHAWVIGGNRSTTGSAILHSDPQILIPAPSVWYEFHICGGDFDVRGIGVAGAPGMLIGWNRNVAWGATAAGADLSDLFKLQVNPSDPNQYYYDGAYRDMEVYQEEIRPRNGDIITITCRKTVWGSVVTPLLTNARPGEEFVLKHAEVFNPRKCSLQSLIEIMKAYDWVSFEEAVENYTSPVIHAIYGDKDGNIGYHLLAGIPLRSRKSPLRGKIAQYGNSSEYDWQEIVPKRYLPHMFNPSSGVIGIANNMAVGSWYPLPLGFGTGDTIRSWRLRERLDVLHEFSQDDVLAIHRDMVNPAVREIVRLARHTVYTLGQNLSTEAMNALDALDTWSGEYNTSQLVYPLIENFNLMFRTSVTPLASIYGGGDAGLCYFAKTIKKNLDQNSSYIPTNDEKNYVDSFLRNAWIKTINTYGSNISDWLNMYDKTILIEYQNNLENFGSLDASKNMRSPELRCKHTNTIWSQHGNSYSQNIRFDDIDASKSVMPPGLSEDPNSPFFDDQIPLWVAGELHGAPLSREIIETMMTSLKQLECRVGDLGGGLPPRFFNFDGNVDGADLVLFVQCYNRLAPPNALYLADLGGGLPPRFFECDEVVDAKDLTLFIKCYNGLGP